MLTRYHAHVRAYNSHHHWYTFVHMYYSTYAQKQTTTPVTHTQLV